MRRKCFWLMGLVAMMLAASGGYSQFPGDGNPTEFFYKLSNGKEVLVRSEMPPFMVAFFDRIAEKVGIKGEEITKAQFEQYMVARQAERSGGDIKVVVDPKADPKAAAPPAAGAPAAPKPLSDSEARWADSMFQRQDRNGDGLLSFDEMSDTLKQEREKWDMNKDGFIDRDEYRPYFQARSQQQRSDRPGGNSGSSTPSATTTTPEPPPAPKPPEEEAKPIVYRAGKLPSDLPAWFTQLDTDADGQIGLYEWKNSGKTMDEFNKLDRNGDGFLTIAEALRPTTTALASAAPAKTATTAPSASVPSSPSGSSSGSSRSGGSGGGWGSFFQRPSSKGR